MANTILDVSNNRKRDRQTGRERTNRPGLDQEGNNRGADNKKHAHDSSRITKTVPPYASKN
jgi:hypothetical protein